MRRLIAEERAPGPKCVTDDDLLAYARATGTTVYHPTSTCRMGSDATAVVDEHLRVRGFDRLRVVDASIMPTLVSGNTNASAVMIGEKGADMILHDAQPPAAPNVHPCLVAPSAWHGRNNRGRRYHYSIDARISRSATSERAMNWNFNVGREPSPARQRAHPAVLRHLPFDRPLSAAGILPGRRSRAQLSHVSVALRHRRGSVVVGVYRSLLYRFVVNLHSALAALEPLGMGAGVAWPVHPFLVDVPRHRDAPRRGLVPSHDLLQHSVHRSMAAHAVGWRRADAGGADGVDPCVHRHPFLASHPAVVRNMAAAVFRLRASAADPGARRLHHGRAQPD